MKDILMSKQADVSNPGTVLVIDDDEQIRRLIFRLLTPMGLALEEAASAEEGLEKLREVAPDLVSYEADGVTPRTVKYGDLSPYFIGAIHRLKADNDNLKFEVEGLRRAVGGRR